MKKNLFTCIVLLTSWASSAQDTVVHKNAIQLEAFGLGRYGSLAYERMVYDGKYVNYYAKAGFSMIRYLNFENKFKPDLLIPIEGIMVLGKKRHHLELSIGQVIQSYSRFSTAVGGPKRDLQVSLSTGLGYRYEKPGGRWQYRLMGYRILDDYEVSRLWAGISAGYKFTLKK